MHQNLRPVVALEHNAWLAVFHLESKNSRIVLVNDKTFDHVYLYLHNVQHLVTKNMNFSRFFSIFN